MNTTMQCPSLDELPRAPLNKEGWPWTEESPALPAKMDDGSPWPKISIVTPSLNQGQFIEETIRSVLLQGYPDLEYIIVDGGSTDNSVEIIKKYEHWIDYWVSKPDKGQSEAINKGFRKATGDIVAWINSDDTYSNHAFKKTALFFHSHLDFDFVYGNVEIINEESREIKVLKPNDINDIKNAGFYEIHQPSCFWKSYVFDKVGYLNEDMHYIFDMEFWLRVHKYYRFFKTDELYANARFHAATKTTTKVVCFALESLEMYKKYFNNNDLPISSNKKEKALRFWNERTARSYMEIKDYRKARTFFFRAIMSDLFNKSNLTLGLDIINVFFKR